MLGPNSRRTFLKSLSVVTGGIVVNGFGLGNALARQLGGDLITRSTWTMGTAINLSVPDAAYEPSLISKAFAQLVSINDKLSAFSSDSELAYLNQNPNAWHAASTELLDVATSAIHFGQLTSGALDVTVLPAMRAYGFIGEPTAQSNLNIDFSKLRVRDSSVFLSSGYGVDFGGIAKGYAVDLSVKEIVAAGVGSALVEAGGDIFAHGARPDGTAWRIGIRNPKKPDELFARISVADRAVATSGGYFQQREVNGTTVSHIIDPSTGKSANNLLSATIIAPTAMEADALATAVMAMSPSRSRGLVESLPNVDAVFVYPDESLFVTRGISSRIEIL